MKDDLKFAMNYKYKLKAYYLVTTTALITSPFITQAQSNEEDLLFADLPSVFTASKYEQKVTDAPARVSVITAEEIRRYGYRSLIEALQSLPGIQYSYDRNYSYIGVRGFNIPGDYGSRVLTLIDGHRINENIYDGALIDQGSLVNLDLVKRIEVVRGPASSLYGSSAFFGVINIITKDGRDLDAAEVSADVGSEVAYQGRVSYGKQYDNGWEVMLTTSAFSRDGDDHYYAEFDDPLTNNGLAEDADDTSHQNLFAKLSYGDFTLSSAYSELEKGIPTASYETVFNDNRNRTWEGQYYLHLDYATLLDSGTEVTGRLYYNNYWYDGDFIYDYPPVAVYKDEGKGEWWGLEAQVSKNLLNSHRLTTGLEYRDSLKADQRAYDVFDTYLDLESNEYTYGLYIQDEWNVNETLTLNLGLRYDDYSNSEDSLNPRLAAIWHSSEVTTLKLLYGSAFRAPNTYELFYDDGGFTQKAALELKPETIESLELILELTLSSSLRLIGSLYKNDIDDLLTLVTDPNDGLEVFTNQGGAEAAGAELEFIVHSLNGWSGSLSYAIQDAELTSGENIPNYAENMAKLNLLAPPIGGQLELGLEVQYEDGRETLAGDKTSSFTLTNLTLSNNQWVEGLSLSASIYNLFDEDYSHPGFQEHLQDQLAQDGRTYRVKASYRF